MILALGGLQRIVGRNFRVRKQRMRLGDLSSDNKDTEGSRRGYPARAWCGWLESRCCESVAAKISVESFCLVEKPHFSEKQCHCRHSSV